MSLYASHHRCAGVAKALFTAFVRSYARPRVYGLDHLPQTGAFIIAANHASHADTAVIFTALPPDLRRRFVAAAARDYFFDGSLRQRSARMLYNVIPVDREASRGRDPLRHVGRALREGYGVLIFPEGTRSRDGKVGPFRGGIGRLMRLFPDVPVIPTWLDGTTKILPKGAAIPRPGSVGVHFGEPLFVKIEPNSRAGEHAAANAVREAVLSIRDSLASS